MSADTFRKLRILILLCILAIVLLNSWLSKVRIQSWQRPIWVVLYPINADERRETQLYVNALDEAHFEDVKRFMQREALRFNQSLTPVVELYLAKPIQSHPPSISADANILQSIVWSLRMRWWAFRHDGWDGPEPDVRIYLRYFSPHNSQVLEHSLGLQKGMIGIVNGFASVDYNAKNSFVITHELMHTLGASDKYDLSSNEPLFPHGYAEPEKKPLLPQRLAEVMGGRVKVSPGWALMPLSLDDVVVGPETAREIGWLDR